MAILSTNAQDCGTETFSKEKTKEIESLLSTYHGISSAGITYLPVKLHLTKSYGTNYYSISQFMFEFAKLNEKFQPLGFQFYLCDSIHYINDYVLDDFGSPYNTSDSLALLANNVDNAINLYYVNNSNFGGRSNFINGNKFYNWMFVKNGVWQGGETLTHEMGHYFNLYHTFETFIGNELVNGNNCSTAGDLVCDTPADTYPTVYNIINCIYNGSAKDGNNQSYTPLTNNIMSYYSGGCRLNFTTGQATRAQAGHASRLNLIAAAGNQYNFSYPANDTIQISKTRTFDLHGSVRVRWNCYSFPVGFLIERSTNLTSGFVAIGGTSGFSREFIDSEVTTGVTYYYRVKAANSKNNYGNVANINSSLTSYKKPTSYNPDVCDLYYFRMYDKGNVSRFFAHFPRNSEPFLDYSEKVYTLPTNEKLSLFWMDYENTSTSRDSFKVWIDFNKNQLFENNEIIAKGFNNNGRSVDSLFISSSLPTGYYRLRFRTSYINDAFTDHDRQRYCDTKDITVFIQGACAQDLPVSDYLFDSWVSGGVIRTVDYVQNYYDPNYPTYTYPVTLKSPSILLNPGFSANGHSPFTAQAGGCP